MNSSYAYKGFFAGLVIIAVSVALKHLAMDINNAIPGKSISTETVRTVDPLPFLPPVIEGGDVAEQVPAGDQNQAGEPGVSGSSEISVQEPVGEIVGEPTKNLVLKPKYLWEWKGLYSGIREPLKLVLKDKASWEQLWGTFTANRPYTVLIPEVDFTRYMIVVLAMGEKPNERYRITIERMNKQGTIFVIYYSETIPAAEMSGMSIQSQPYHMKVVPLQSVSVLFKKIE